MTAENRLRQLEQSVSLRDPLIEKFIRYGVCLKEGTVEQTFQRRDCTVQPYCRQGAAHTIGQSPAHATGGRTQKKKKQKKKKKEGRKERKKEKKEKVRKKRRKEEGGGEKSAERGKIFFYF